MCKRGAGAPGLALRGSFASFALAVFVTVACRNGDAAAAPVIAGASAERGSRAIQRYGCTACHMVPGIERGSYVAPPLTSWSRRTYIAGEVSNTPEHLVRWIEDPKSIEPGTVMPNLGVTAADARDIAEYLYTIR